MTTTTKIVGSGDMDTSYGSDSWFSTGNITANDSNVASLLTAGASTSKYLRGLMSGNEFSLAVDQVIDGIELKIKISQTGGSAASFDRVRLVKGGTVQSTDRTTLASLPASLTVVTFGGSSDLWGTTWSVSDINASNFGAVLSVTYNDPTDSEVDYFEITIHHHTDDAFGPITLDANIQ